MFPICSEEYLFTVEHFFILPNGRLQISWRIISHNKEYIMQIILEDCSYMYNKDRLNTLVILEI